MTRGRKIVLVIGIATVGVAGWIVYGLLHTLYHIPDAYAAWDTGTLLIEYMERHDRRWPRSWDDLLSVLEPDSGRQIPLRGAQPGDLRYARSLREKVVVDWTFDPARPDDRSPVSPRDGGTFPVLWQGAEPNEMIRDYLANRPSTQPSDDR